MEPTTNTQKTCYGPLRVRVQNTTDTIQRARILFPNARSADNYGNPKGVFVTSIPLSVYETAEQAYDEMLYSLGASDIIIGSVFVQAITNNAQVQQRLTLQTNDYMKSQHTQIPIVYLKDPYQNQCDVLVNNQPLELKNSKGCVSGIFVNILPNAQVDYYFYPASRQESSPEKQTFDSPNIIRVLSTYDGSNFDDVIDKPQDKPTTTAPKSRKSTATKPSAPVKKSAPKKAAFAFSLEQMDKLNYLGLANTDGQLITDIDSARKALVSSESNKRSSATSSKKSVAPKKAVPVPPRKTTTYIATKKVAPKKSTK